VITIDPDRCVHCGESKEVDHHPIPKVRGGWFTIPLCGKCHSLAHHRDGNMSNKALTREALAAKRARGEKCGGPPPYGKQLADDGKTLVPRADEQAVLDRIKSLRTEGYSFGYIVDRLNDEGLPRRNGQWDHVFIHRLCKQMGVKLENPLKRRPCKPRTPKQDPANPKPPGIKVYAWDWLPSV
jgi:Recombinase